MKHSTRNLVAATAAQQIAGESLHELVDCTHAENVPIDHVRAAERRVEDARLLITSAEEERVSLTVHGDVFRGWDHESGHFFAGAVYESNLLLFDGQNRRYYQYQIH